MRKKIVKLVNNVSSQSTRHRKAPKWSEEFEEYSITLSELLDRLEVDSSRYYEILNKILLNTEHIHFKSLLPEGDLSFLKKFSYTLTTFGFRSTNIEYLSLYGIGAKKAKKWAQEYNISKDAQEQKQQALQKGKVSSKLNTKPKPIMYKNVAIGIYSTLINKDAFKNITDQFKIENYIKQIMEEKIYMFSYTDDSKIMQPIRFFDAKQQDVSDRKK